MPTRSENEWAEEIFDHVKQCDYRAAFRLTKEMKREYPNSLRANYQEASVGGDYALHLAGRSREILHRASIRKLRRLTVGMRKSRHWLLRHARNELFFQTGNHKRQFENGVIDEKAGKGSYGAGVGAAHHALGLARRGDWKRATLWASRAVEAWKRELARKPDYYNSYVHYALALGLLGRSEEMEKALGTSARLCGQPSDYVEFRWTRETIARLSLGAGAAKQNTTG